MKSFNFDDWTFSYECITDNGKLNSVQKKMSDYISESDIFWISGCEKPIITRSGITKLMESFNLRDVNIVINLTSENEHGVFVSAIVEMHDSANNIYFVGDGEASNRNTTGLASAYLQAMAVKRGRSRGVLNYLRIDAYGEDEAESFTAQKPISIEQLNPKDIEKIQDLFSKKTILNLIKREGASFDKEDLINLIKMALHLDKDEKLTMNSLSYDQLFFALKALILYNEVGVDKCNHFMSTKGSDIS